MIFHILVKTEDAVFTRDIEDDLVGAAHTALWAARQWPKVYVEVFIDTDDGDTIVLQTYDTLN